MIHLDFSSEVDAAEFALAERFPDLEISKRPIPLARVWVILGLLLRLRLILLGF